MQQQVFSFGKKLTKLLKDISQPNGYKNMMTLVSSEFTPYTNNILAIAVINEVFIKLIIVIDVLHY